MRSVVSSQKIGPIVLARQAILMYALTAASLPTTSTTTSAFTPAFRFIVSVDRKSIHGSSSSSSSLGGWMGSVPTWLYQPQQHQQQQQQQQLPRVRLFSVSPSTKTSDTPVTLPEFANVQDYLEYLGTVSALPKGFATGTASGKFVSVEAPALGPLPIRGTVIYLPDGPTDSWAAVFTQNKFPGAPILVGRSRLAQGGPLHAVVINNKVSNVCAGGDGVGNAEQVCAAVAEALSLPGGASSVLPSSTGVIGWRLPAAELANVIPQAVQQLQSESALPAAQAIMTTDRYPKVRSITLSNGARVVGIAKGAGMIEPNLATMLSYLMTDATVDRDTMQRILSRVVQDSFNSVSVDGDESTSDTVVFLASNQIAVGSSVSENELESALRHVCLGLAADLVRNGEGTAHVLRVMIANYPGTSAEARRLGRHVVNSPLFKCAVAGNDPNTGRLAAAIGSWLGKFFDSNNSKLDLDQVKMTLGGRLIFANKKFVLEGDEVEKALSQHIKDAEYSMTSNYPPHQKCVEIAVDFGTGSGQAVVLGSDLTTEYIAINADYRS